MFLCHSYIGGFVEIYLYGIFGIYLVMLFLAHLKKIKIQAITPSKRVLSVLDLVM